MKYQIITSPDAAPKLDLGRIGGNALPRFSKSRAPHYAIPPDVLAAMTAMNLAPPFVPPSQSRATRYIALRGRGSQRGATHVKYGGLERMVVFESLLELHTLHILLSDTSLIDIWDQPPPIPLRNRAGKKTTHTLDYLAVYADGRKVGYAVKPSRKVFDEHGNPTEFVELMGRVRTAAGFEIRIVTEKSFSRSQVQDARLMHRWSRQSDPEADAVVRDIVRSLQGSYPVRTIKDLSGLKGRAFGAVVRAYRDGLLTKADGKRLHVDSMVRTVRDAD
ncbi:hypothetical protein SAMN06295905_1607 [Devosia lucknowensis]|uniref:TnsA endonuclease N terminal n=1 Tax=Devosia lucknowensis TaxID=1096929 RepID=A0A1Y6F2B5_9HYPH|nr:hypothetical protein [Devosia lucknowensis]SMQ68626.1 hypothetical protein SAMN06295905_1607 [Devosia lucknowensis]